MLIRELVGLSRSEIDGDVEGYPVQSVVAEKGGYQVWLGTGEVILARGHDRLSDLRRAKVAHSSDRIQRYGNFGTSI